MKTIRPRTIGMMNVLTFTGLALALTYGCNGGDDSTDSDIDGGDTDTDTDSDTDTDTGEDETPPDLPELCTLDIAQSSASEKDDLSSPDKGNGRTPDIAFNGSTLMVWSYFSKEEDATWEIQAAPYDPLPDGGLPGPDGGPPGPVGTPASKGPVAQMSSIAARGQEFGIVWLDGRWDPNCDESNFGDCHRDIAFLNVDSTGQALSGPGPSRITIDTDVASRPDIAATENGYVVTWVELADSINNVMAKPIDESGNPGDSQQVSTDEGPKNDSEARAAAIGDTVVVTWSDEKQRKILVRVLDGDAVAIGNVATADEGTLCYKPRIAAGAGEFMLSWNKQPYDDIEIYTRKLDGSGTPVGEANRITWTTSDVFDSALAFNGSCFSVAWLCTRANGADEPVVETAEPQVFAGLLDENGALSAVPVLLSNDPNNCNNLQISWDGGGWTAVWELPRDMRNQIFYGRMTCE
jgi:hypothetical protein